MATLYSILQIALIVFGILLTILVMCRKGEVGGLSGAFGGLGGDTAFGVKAQKQLDKIITYIAILFLVIVILMNTPMFRNAGRNISVEGQQESSAPAKE
jgi:preprotein translocase subunit SecG